MKFEILAIIGPTASGKTRRAVAIAEEIGGEIISGDSRQIYKGMNIGTGKDLDEYHNIPFHLIDICEAGEKYNLHRFVSDFHNVFSDVRCRGVMPILCGGSGMYMETILSGIILPEVPENPLLRQNLDKLNLEELASLLEKYKKLHNTTDIDSKKRAIRAIEIEEFYRENPDFALKADKKKSKPLNALIIGIDIPRNRRRELITDRLDKRLNEGMIEEVRGLLDSGISPDNLIYYGLEYKFVTLFLIGNLTYKDMREKLEIAIHQFAKRQMTWFRGMEKRGYEIHWLPFDLTIADFNKRVKGLLLAE